MKNVLFIVYYFPPMGGSGVQRPLKFAKYLRDYGWNPIILCPEPGLYHTFDTSLLEELESLDLDIHRVSSNSIFHKTGTKSLSLPTFIESFLRKISSFFWLPDNKKGWIKPGIDKAREIIEKQNIDLIFSTAPPYSNLLIAKELKQEFKIPVVYDFRDEWLESHFFEYHSKFHYDKMKQLENEVIKSSDQVISINKYITESIQERHPEAKVDTITQGFDPENFENQLDTNKKNDSSKCRFIYSGTFYPQSGPEYFFQAISELIKEDESLSELIELHFQGNLTSSFNNHVKNYGLKEIVHSNGYITHQESIKNLYESDILWLSNGHKQNIKIISFGKTYEYMATGKPILGLVPNSDVKDTLECYRGAYICDPFSVEEIKSQIVQILDDWRNDSFPPIDQDFVDQFNREKLTENLAQIFNVISY